VSFENISLKLGIKTKKNQKKKDCIFGSLVNVWEPIQQICPEIDVNVFLKKHQFSKKKIVVGNSIKAYC
jgi:hypothetical protein